MANDTPAMPLREAWVSLTPVECHWLYERYTDGDPATEPSQEELVVCLLEALASGATFPAQPLLAAGLARLGEAT